MKKLKFILAAVAVIAITTVTTEAQVLKGLTRQTGYTNLVCPSTITSMAVSNFTSQPLFIQPGYGVYVWATATGINATNINQQQIYLDTSPDGTHWTTTSQFVLAWNLNGTTPSAASTNIPAFCLDGAAAIRVRSWTNGTGATISGLTNILSRIRP